MRHYLKLILLSAIFFTSANLSAQPAGDSVKKKKPVATHVIIKSGAEKYAGRDNSTWENRWQNHIDRESIKIAEKVLLRDSSKIVYNVIIEFSINEDSSLKD